MAHPVERRFNFTRFNPDENNNNTLHLYIANQDDNNNNNYESVFPVP